MSVSMKILRLYKSLLDIATTEFVTVVESGEIFYSQGMEPWKVRLYLCDGSIVDIYYSVKGKYSYHWDRRLITHEIFRHDNAPHQRWKYISSFPKHFHKWRRRYCSSKLSSRYTRAGYKRFSEFCGKTHNAMTKYDS